MQGQTGLLKRQTGLLQPAESIREKYRLRRICTSHAVWETAESRWLYRALDRKY